MRIWEEEEQSGRGVAFLKGMVKGAGLLRKSSFPKCLAEKCDKMLSLQFNYTYHFDNC